MPQMLDFILSYNYKTRKERPSPLLIQIPLLSIFDHPEKTVLNY